MRDSDNLQEILRALGHAHTALAQIHDLDLHDSRENHHPQTHPIAPLDDDPDELDDLRILHEVTGIAFQALAGTEELFEGRKGTRGPYFQFAKSEDFFQRSLSYPDRWFRRLFRMSRATFDRVVALLEKNDVFQSSGKRPQRPVKFQLACFLIRYGARGAESLDPAQKVSLGHGTVFLYCRRVVYAIRCLRHSFVQWPNREKCQENAEAVEEKTGIPGVIGIVDGPLIPFARVPKIDAHLWFTRKKFPGANIQATVDHNRRFTSYEIGHCGSVPDVTIFKKSQIWRRRPAYFNPGDIILADKGYPCSPYTLRPFVENELGNTPDKKRRRCKFNKALSGERIEVEHAFGDLKGRFQALKCLGGIDNLGNAFRAVEALIILHNICLDFGDNAHEIPDFTLDDEYPLKAAGDEDPDVEVEPEYQAWLGLARGVQNRRGETDHSMKLAGYTLRLQVLDKVAPP